MSCRALPADMREPNHLTSCGRLAILVLSKLISGPARTDSLISSQSMSVSWKGDIGCCLV
jgi:hypothetical protein